MWRKIWHWLRCEDENGKPLDDSGWIVGINDVEHKQSKIKELKDKISDLKAQLEDAEKELAKLS